MIYDEKSGNYVNSFNKVTYPKRKIVEYLKLKGQKIFSSQGRGIEQIELSDQYDSILKPTFMKERYYSHNFRYYVDDYPLKVSLALEFLVRENYNNVFTGLMDHRDVVVEYFRQNQENEEEVFDTIRQIITLGYLLCDGAFYKNLKIVHTGKRKWDDYVITNNIELKTELIYQVIFEYGYHPMDDHNPNEYVIRLYSRFAHKITLYELVYIHLYNSRFNDM